MDFVDHVDLEATMRGRIHGSFKQRRHVFNRTVTCRVHFDVVRVATFVNCTTSWAHATRMCRHITLTISPLAIEGLSENTRNRRLTHTTRTRKEISMMQALFSQSTGQCGHDMVLTDNGFKVMRSPFSSEYLITTAHPYSFSLCDPSLTSSVRRV